ncbi:MAG TPA: aminopeptidase P family protein [Myxococcaceae bacterium]|nr:aminopeptidase P family protein [Myxococcaceae bacterium]
MTFDKDATPVTSEPQGPAASHDSSNPPALLEFMTKHWKPAVRKPARLPNAAAFNARRRALSAHFPGEWLVIPAGHEKVRSNDDYYRFRPGSDFYYLTGNLEPDCVLVLEPLESGHRDVLFVEPNPGRTDATFFTDRRKGELWVGGRLGVEQSRTRFAVDEVRGLPDLGATLEKARAPGNKVRVVRGFSEELDRQMPDGAERDAELTTVLSEMRLIKDKLEIRELESVIASTRRGFEDVIRAMKNGGTERHAEGTFNLRARVEGNDVGYGTIAAAGAHACVLHWKRNDGPLEKGELLLLDAGVEGHSLYTADITRTLPISGRYSKEQREIYELVYAAQAAAFEAVKPGNDFLEPNRQAMRVLAEGLERLGILPMPAEEALKEEHLFYKRYSLHNVSHMLGLDVHDCAKAREEAYKQGKLKAGMVLTVEPGLYFQTDDLTVPRRYRGIGVRIEDDVLVTPSGMRNLSADIPSAPAEVEAWIAELWGARPKRRRLLRK